MMAIVAGCTVQAQTPSRAVHTITWTLDRSMFPEDPSQKRLAPAGNLRAQLARQLNDPRGWTRAGVRFAYRGNVKSAKLVFRLLEYPTIESECGNATRRVEFVGCAERLPRGRWLVRLEYQLTPFDKRGRAYRPSSDWVVNHELGHIFLGPAHTRTGLMRRFQEHPRTAGDSYPSEADIRAARAKVLAALALTRAHPGLLGKGCKLPVLL
jgi:hypothetical protein